MVLKRIFLQGYKTFANKTEFIFDDGMTAIVGPNGSGKSNVADAVRWVLGEQSHSELRSKRTTDMIFSGSRLRPRSGMAQVFITLDNSGGLLPIDYAEVEIGRRAYRSGENEYLLNGQKVRLRDISELLAASGLGRRTYNIIGQGLVDRALSLRADERRALFEEAAGIAHYKQRRAESLRRLKETQRNLERVNDVLAEIRPRLNSLKRQAARAQNYEQVADDLRHLLRTWYGYQWEATRVTLRERRVRADGAEKEWKSIRRQLSLAQDTVEERRTQIRVIEARVGEKQASSDDVRSRLETARRQVAVLEERERLTAEQLAAIEREIPDLKIARDAAQEELSGATGELEAAQLELDRSQTVIKSFEAAFADKRSAIDKAERKVETLNNQLASAQQRAGQADGQLSQLRERLTEYDGESSGNGSVVNNGTVVEVESAVAALNATLESTRGTLQTTRNQRREQRDQQQALIRDIKQQRRDTQKKTNRVNQLSKEVARLEARVDLLDQLRRDNSDIAGNVNIIGRLAQLIDVPEANRVAIEAALAARLTTLIVADKAAIWAILDANPDQELLAVATDVLPTVAKRKIVQGAVGWARDIVVADSAISAAADYLLDGVLLVNDRDSAYANGSTLDTGDLAVTPDGLVVYGGGLVHVAGSGVDALAQQRAFEAAEEQLATTRDELAGAQKSAETDTAAIEAKQAEIDALGESMQALLQQEQGESQAVSQAQSAYDRQRQQVSFLQKQLDDRQAQVARLTERIAKLEAEVETNQTTTVRVGAELETARLELTSLPTDDSEQERLSLQQKVAGATTILAGRRAVTDSRRATLVQADSRLRRLEQRQAELQQQREAMNLSAEMQTRTSLQTQLEQLSADLKPLRAQQTKLRSEIADVDANQAVLQKKALSLETGYTQAQVALTQQESLIEGLKDRIKADLGLVALSYDQDENAQAPLPMEEIVEQLPTVEALPDGIDESIQKRRVQLQRMGAVNPDAPAEYAEARERHDFLEGQIEDLIKTEAQLRGVIAELDELTSRAFADTVEKVNQVFGEMFTQLFGGGTGELVLTEPDDLTITGVDIYAQLPGKRQQGLNLLSGGERSLTAAALIFSLLKVSPTPFCVMDEMDAALDEANINRFVEALQELAQKTQFVVITHNRGTVRAASTIYGISMLPDSTSQALSIKPEEYVQVEAEMEAAAG